MDRDTARFFLLINVILSVNGDYVLRVEVGEYSNPTNRCTMCGGGCCDDFTITTCNGQLRCDNEFFFCLRPLEAAHLPASIVGRSIIEDSLTERARALGCLASPPALRSTEIDINSIFNTFSSSGLPNPIEFAVVATEWKGIQLYVDVVDRDLPNSRSFDELINLFQLQVNISAGGGMTVSQTFHGQLQFSNLTLSFQVECLPGFTGDNCLQDHPDETTTSETTVTPPTTSATTGREFTETHTGITATGSAGETANPSPLVTETTSNAGMVAGIVAGSVVLLAFLAVAIVVVASLVMLRKNKAKKATDPFHGSGDFNPEQLENPLYGTTGITSTLNRPGTGSSEEAERNLDNPVYGLSTDLSDPTYATPLDVAVSHYDMDTSYDAPTEADYYEIESTDAPNSTLTIGGHYDATYGTIP